MEVRSRDCDETDTLRGLGLLVVDYLRAGNLVMPAEEVLQLRVTHRERQITHQHPETRLVMPLDVVDVYSGSACNYWSYLMMLL